VDDAIPAGWPDVVAVAASLGRRNSGMLAILGVVSVLLLSDEVRTGNPGNGPIGVMIVLLIRLIGTGMATIVGAVAGAVWQERKVRLG
jgi:hypothetical protein